jgi:PAS domain S-box-containing protein
VGLVAHRGELFAAEVARAAAERARQDAETSAKALAASEARFRRALEIETVGVIFFDTEGAITDANDAFLRMSGYSRTDLAAGRVRWDTMTPPEWMPRSLGAVKELKETGQTTPYEKEYLRKNGSRWWALFAATLLDPERGVEFVLDLTERKAAEAERERALAEARAAVQARDEFLAIASHELRNPLAGLKGNAQMLRRLDERGELQPHELGKYLTALEASADRLTRLVEDLLDVARLRTGQLKLRREVANLPKLLQEAADRQQHGNLARKITLKITCPNCHVRADPDRVGQVLSNLLDNAVKYSPSGGDISVSLAAADDAVVVRVTDQGIGLPAGMAESIFEPFGRAPNAAAQQIPGMGLGLYISRQIAEAHGGRLWAESAGEGEGATFTLWLPIGAAESA